MKKKSAINLLLHIHTHFSRVHYDKLDLPHADIHHAECVTFQCERVSLCARLCLLSVQRESGRRAHRVGESRQIANCAGHLERARGDHTRKHARKHAPLCVCVSRLTFIPMPGGGGGCRREEERGRRDGLTGRKDGGRASVETLRASAQA